jgi:hypothetical protein
MSLSSKAWRQAAIAGPLVASAFFGGFAASAAECPTVADPKGLAGAFPEQAEVEEAKAANVTLAFSENPLFATTSRPGGRRRRPAPPDSR